MPRSRSCSYKDLGVAIECQLTVHVTLLFRPNLPRYANLNATDHSTLNSFGPLRLLTFFLLLPLSKATAFA